MLISFGGLSGTGKTTIAREVVRELDAVYLRIDSIEQVMRQAGWQVEGEGYHVARAIAEDNLRLGRIVVADCVNPWPLTRAEWRAVAERAGVPALEVEIVCSDRHEHKRRVETRTADIAGHRLPTWQEVIARDYQEWISQPGGQPIVIDTARVAVEEAVRAIVTAVRDQRAAAE
jgi:predicted kinase